MESRTGDTQRDEQAYNLIMKDKERLLSFDEPTAFIFSHSALREGWDSPNVFQICTLNQTISEMRKRQEVGRGVRLAVDQAGERVHDEQVNVLTVIANESYERYVETLQSEIASEYRDEIEARYGKSIGDLTDEERQAIEAEYGQGILPPQPADARKRGVARLRKHYTLKPEFQELWERIKHKTRYAVQIDTEQLLTDTVAELDQAEIRPPRVTVTRAQVEVDADGALQALQTSAARTVVDLAGRYPLPNFIEIMTNLLEQTTPPVRLGQRTLLEVFRRTSNKQAAMDNPHEFATVAVQTIKTKLADQLVDGIRYEKINEWYEMTKFDTEISTWQQYLVPSEKSDGSDGSRTLRPRALRIRGGEIVRGRPGGTARRAALPEAAGLVHCAHTGRELQPGLGHRDGERGRRAGRPTPVSCAGDQEYNRPGRVASERGAEGSLRRAALPRGALRGLRHRNLRGRATLTLTLVIAA